MASREARNLREKDAKSVGRGRGREEVEEASRTRKETNRGKRRKNEKEKKETKKKRERDICSKSKRVSWGARRMVRIAEITMWMEQDPSSRQRRKRTSVSWKEGGERVPSYHAASIGPLIFAALRFCLALSTLHTSTADRSHKTLYQGSAENRETFVRRCPIVSAQCTTSARLSSLPAKPSSRNLAK